MYRHGWHHTLRAALYRADEFDRHGLWFWAAVLLGTLNILIQKRFCRFSHLLTCWGSTQNPPRVTLLLRSSNNSKAHTNRSVVILSDPSQAGQFIMRNLLLHRWTQTGERCRRKQRCAHACLARQQASLEPKWPHSLFMEPREQAFAIFIRDIDLTVSDCENSTSRTPRWDHNPAAETASFPKGQIQLKCCNTSLVHIFICLTTNTHVNSYKSHERRNDLRRHTHTRFCHYEMYFRFIWSSLTFYCRTILKK